MGGLIGGLTGLARAILETAGRAAIFVLAGRRVAQRLQKNTACWWAGVFSGLALWLIGVLSTTGQTVLRSLEHDPSDHEPVVISSMILVPIASGLLALAIAGLDHYLDEHFRH